MSDLVFPRKRTGIESLLVMARWALLRQQKVVISALEFLPKELVPQLFLDAFHFRCTDTLKAIGQMWPFPTLPLGRLLDEISPHMTSLEAVLDGIDLLLAQDVRPRRSKLQVLDFSLSGDQFWNQWCNIPVRWDREVKPPLSGGSCKKGHNSMLLQVIIDLTFGIHPLPKVETHILHWAKHRKDIHLCCRKITFLHLPVYANCLIDIELTCIQEVEADLFWNLSTPMSFIPLLGQMRNLQRLIFHKEGPPSTFPMIIDVEQLFMGVFLHQFVWLSLRELYLDTDTFSEGHLDQVLRYLKTHLETLSITECVLLEPDMTHLSQCPYLTQLKELNLNGTSLKLFSSPLRILLQNCAPTLQDLNLGVCGLQDSHLQEILPALKLCSQLRILKLHGNRTSMSTLVQLVRHLVGLPHLMTEVYPAPLESYGTLGNLHQRSFDLHCAEMRNVLRDLRKPRSIFLSTNFCSCCVKIISHN